MDDGLNELRHLYQELSLVKRPLEALLSRFKTDASFNELQKEISKELNDIDKTIATCMAVKRRNRFGQLFATAARRERAITLDQAVKKIRKEKIPLLTKCIVKMSIKPRDVRDMPLTTDVVIRETRSKKTQKIVGFVAETKDLINFINAESTKLEITSIVGMAGLGKTILAWKIFNDPVVQYEFPIRIWVSVSDTPNMKNILLTILKKFDPNPPDEPVHELIIKVGDHLKEGKFFIVLDNVWTLYAWDKVKEILPTGNHMGRVLVTTRIEDVAVHSSTREAHYLRFLTDDESWELLQYEVYGELNVVPNDLKGIGQVIATYCSGLPLSLVVIGGILREKTCRAGSNVSVMKKDWQEVTTSMEPYLVDGDKKILQSSIISLSYEKIPYEMRNCFLYLGVFPEGADIPVKKLIWLWIAEGFILESGGKGLEQVALANLKWLINRNFVTVKEMKLGEPKVCNIPNWVHEICKTKAKYENLNLFQEITNSAEGFEPRDNVENFRRLCVHSYVIEFLRKVKKVPKARSFLCFHQSPMILKPADMAIVTDGFGLLRVYDAINIKFPKFPQKIVQLTHLRYLTLVVEHCTSLPEAISELWNLQILIVDVSSSTLDIKADIWKMRQLRHIKTKASITLKNDLRGEGGDNLQTLSRLSPESCTTEVFRRAKNLITLGIQGNLNKIFRSDYLGNLERLHKLKLVNEAPNVVVAENPLQGLTYPHKFPPNLKILVLSRTYIQWSKMSILSYLSILEVLKLKENAFTGNYWEATDVFHHLEHLEIERFTELVSWKASGHPFPKLRFLLLNNCEKLIEVPTGVCENLEKLYLEHVTEDLVSSVEAIDEEKRKNNVAFKFYITPEDNIKPLFSSE